MVRKNTRVIGMTTAISAVSGVLFSLIMLFPSCVQASNESTTFEVNVVDTLTVSIDTPSSWASGDAGDFLRNKINLSVMANNNAGFTASMYANNTNLTNTSNSSISIAPLGGSTQRSSANFNNKWGYSLGAYTLNGVTQNSYTLNSNSYGETSAGNDNSYYYPMVSTSNSPITVIDGATTAKTSGTQEIYFGTKADLSQAAGTYTSTVVISVVTGTVDSTNNPTTPTDPATPSTDTTPNDSDATYTGEGTSTGVGNSANPANGTTVYTTTTTTTNTTNTTTQISAGDTTSSYTAPQGVVDTKINEGTPLATGLAVTSAVAAATGIVFFIIAKRREDEEDKDEY